MAKLNFSFAGESIQSSKLESKTRKFDLEFESNTYLSFIKNPTFSVEYFFSINNYAENLSDAFHMAAKEAGIEVAQFNVIITGNLDSNLTHKENFNNSIFNKIDVSLSIKSNAPDEALEQLLKLANELNPIEESIANQVRFQFSLNSVIHLN
ncbi:hypothetical protein F0919_00155 [Taibaiella lutea]|uniref:OsmC family peroxiredoxin n=1 Tax=Taibaiella lutea TaxID=2608001 RepID=A0A5M6CSK0_9BACT|nr:OsmC family protein [Taibaiella lutea]KAA5536119.1 hypothetical protein F0919_00155 [Taibaiella lutea]